MKTNVPGLLELECGWWLAIGSTSSTAATRVKVLAANESRHIVEVLDLSELEALEVEEALHRARTGHGLSERCDHER